MGFISTLAKQKVTSFPKETPSPRAVWDRVFGTTKEDGGKQSAVQTPATVPWDGRSAINQPAFERLLNIMRSRAPGGWSDNKWEQSQHWNGIQYVGGHRVCEQLAQSEFEILKKDPAHPKGQRPVETGEAEYQLHYLLERPNNKDSWGEWMYKVGQQMMMTGLNLTWMVPNRLGFPYEMYAIPTALALPQPVALPDYPEGYYKLQPFYPYGPFSGYPGPSVSGAGANVPAQWMLQIKFPHPLLQYEGVAPFKALGLHIDEVESIDKSRWYSMKRSINPSAVLQGDGADGATAIGETEVDRIHAQWEAGFQGVDNHGNLIVTQPGFRLEPWGAKPQEMDYYNGWEQLVSFVLAGLGITKSVAGMTEDSQYSVLFAALKQFHLLTLQPLCNRIAGVMTRFLAPFFGPDIIIKVKCPKIDDHEVAERKAVVGAQTKCITKNEVRELLDMPPTDEEWGEDIAGDPSPKEKEQMAEQLEANMAMAEEAGMMQGAPGQGGPTGEDDGMPQSDEEGARPDTGGLGKGGKGPQMKSLRGYDHNEVRSIMNRHLPMLERLVEDEAWDQLHDYWEDVLDEVGYADAQGVGWSHGDDAAQLVARLRGLMEVAGNRVDYLRWWVGRTVTEFQFGEAKSTPMPTVYGGRLSPQYRQKSMYDVVTKALTNGNGNGRHH